jgi:hypothetical protein
MLCLTLSCVFSCFCCPLNAIKPNQSEEEGMSGSDVGSGSGSESEDGEQKGGSSEEYGAGSDSEDADRKYEDAMES